MSVPAGKISAFEKYRNQIQGLTTTLTKTDRILSGRPVNVKIDPFMKPEHPPAMSNGVDIKFNEAVLKESMAKFPRRFLLLLLGLNYHELSHVMYSPRKNDTNEMKHIIANGLFPAWNILEDQRIEALFAATYGSASKFLTAPVTQLILDDKSAWPTAHMLTHGRKYLPLKIRQSLASKFKGTRQQRREVERIIDEFRKLDYVGHPSLGPKMVRLVKDFHRIMVELGMTHPGCSLDHAGGLTQGVAVKALAKEASRRREEQDEEQEAAEEAGEDGSNFWPEREEESPDSDDEPQGDSGNGDDDSGNEEEPDSADEADRGGKGSPEDDESADPPSGGSVLDNAVDASDDDEGDGDDAGSRPGGDSDAGENPEDGDDDRGGDSSSVDGAGVGVGPGGEIDDAALQALAEEVLDYISNDEEVQSEINQVQAGMDDTSGVDLVNASVGHKGVDVDEELLGIAARIETEIRRLNEAHEAGWNYGTDHGRLNVGRAMVDDDTDNWFDSFEEGHEMDTGLEVILLIDNSGSMQGSRITAASKSAWVLKVALDRNDAVTSALCFDTDIRTLYKREEQAEPGRYKLIYANGGTQPKFAFREARRILNVSEKPNRLLVVIADGEFSYRHEDQADYVETLGAIDATRVFIGIETGMRDYLRPVFDVHKTITDPMEIVPVVATVVEEIIRNAGR